MLRYYCMQLNSEERGPLAGAWEGKRKKKGDVQRGEKGR